MGRPKKQRACDRWSDTARMPSLLLEISFWGKNEAVTISAKESDRRPVPSTVRFPTNLEAFYASLFRVRERKKERERGKRERE